MKQDTPKIYQGRFALWHKIRAALVLAVLLSAGATSGLAQAGAPALPIPLLPPANEGAIRLTALNGASTYDFGLVRAGAAAEHVFTVRNDTAGPIVLDRAAPSCHCTGALLLPTPGGGMRLVPGQTARVQVTLNTQEAAAEADPQGRVVKTVSVYVVGQPIHPAVVLTLTCRIVSGAAFDPPLLDFGTIPAGQGSRRTVRLFFAAPNARLAAVGDDRLQLRRLSTAHTSAGDVQTYQVAVVPKAAAGPLNAAVAVTGETASTASLPVTAQVAGTVSARPPTLVFGLVPTGTTAAEEATRRTRWVLLSSPKLRPADAPAYWERATLQSPNSDWQAALVTPGRPLPSGPGQAPPDWAIAESAGPTCWLRVTLQAAAPAGQWLADRVRLSFPDGSRLLVPVAGENAAPTVSVQPAPPSLPISKAVHL